MLAARVGVTGIGGKPPGGATATGVPPAGVAGRPFAESFESMPSMALCAFCVLRIKTQGHREETTVVHESMRSSKAGPFFYRPRIMQRSEIVLTSAREKCCRLSVNNLVRNRNRFRGGRELRILRELFDSGSDAIWRCSGGRLVNTFGERIKPDRTGTRE
jgi:hypothetical protein